MIKRPEVYAIIANLAETVQRKKVEDIEIDDFFEENEQLLQRNSNLALIEMQKLVEDEKQAESNVLQIQ